VTTLAARGSGTPATTGTTWATVTNAVDGAAGTNPATYATMTSTTSAAVATIEVTGYGFSSSIAAVDTLNSISVSLRHFENNTGRFASVAVTVWDGATQIGGSNNCTLATAARNDAFTYTPTVAQIRSATFKVRVTITGAASTQSRVESIDYVDVTADYTPLPPTITQAAYRFYADDVESSTLADSYAETNADSNFGTHNVVGPAVSQSFLGNGGKLSRVDWYLSRLGSPTGTLTAVLYAHTGTFGSSSKPTGSPLATSMTGRAAGSVGTGSGAWYNFDFDGTFTLVNGTPYCITIGDDTATTGSDEILVWVDSSSPTAPGNLAIRFGSVWTGGGGSDASLGNYDAAYRVYTGAAALAAENTAYTADVTAGDVNLLVRTRLQSTNAGVIAATDDWQLQREKNASGTWNNVVGSAVEALSDNYGSANRDDFGNIVSSASFWAQSFTGDGSFLTRAGLYLSKAAAPTGQLRMELWTHSGVFGTSGVRGSLLATSTTTTDLSTLTAGTYAWRYVTFAGTFQLVAGTNYVLVGQPVAGAVIDSTNQVLFGCDVSAPTHPGNAQNGSTGLAVPGTDLCFEVYTTPSVGTVVPYNSPNLTDAAATTNRLTAGTGSFVAGEISETGLVTDLGWTANNYTELLYAVTLKRADLANSDTLRFRVLRNGATTSMTYTQTPTINVTKTSVGGRPKVYLGSFTAKPLKVYSGSAFNEKPVKVWTGSTWKTLT
jgi:hypothetical protein